MIWFTSDSHLGHANIIRYCRRPFNNVDEMNKTIIDNWNSRVGKDDIIYHLGDFCFGNAQNYLHQLNGNILFVRGSHDKDLINLIGSERIPYMRKVETHGQTIVLSHCCMRVWEKSHFDSWHLYGHSHGTLPPIGKSKDVGVDCNNFYPVSFDEIKEYMNTRPHNANWLRQLPGYNEDEFKKAKENSNNEDD